MPHRGEIWWVRVDKRRPVIVVQTDSVADSRVHSFLAVPLTSRLHLEGLPGNLRLGIADTGLPKSSVANVYDIQKVFRSDFIDRVGAMPPERLIELSSGLRLVLGL